jgi:hypothetical protein
MARRLELRGERVYPITPKWGNRIHLTARRSVRFGDLVPTVCGRLIGVGIGGGIETLNRYLGMHDSITCQPCREALNAHGRII